MIKGKFLGPGEAYLKEFADWWEKNSAQLLAENNKDGYLNFSDWPWDDNDSSLEDIVNSFSRLQKDLLPCIHDDT